MTKHIGITGQMGSGKTFICKIFEENFQIPVFYSDKEAKKCYGQEETKKAVCDCFGNSILHPDGTFNWQALGDIVFQDQQKLQKLNAIIHPRVMANYQAWKARQQAPYTLFESAIIYEQHFENLFDAIILIHCPENIVMERVKLRNGWDEKTVIQRLNQQQIQENFQEKADFLILHDSLETLSQSRKKLLPKIEKIHHSIIEGKIK